MADQKETIQWDQFIDACRELSEAQYQEGWDQEAHTKEVESLLERLRLTEEQRDKFLSKYENRIPDFPEIGHLHYERRFMISLVEFEKGDVIPLHDHPDMTGVVLCIEGRVDVQHFDKLEETSNSNRPLLQEERTVQMKPGDIATLTTEQEIFTRYKRLSFHV